VKDMHPGSGLTHQLNISAADLVTETDKAVEDMVSSTLREKYPDYEYVILHASLDPIVSYCTTLPARSGRLSEMLILTTPLPDSSAKKPIAPAFP